MKGKQLLVFSGQKIDPEFARDHDLDCAMVDYASIAAAHRDDTTTPGCTFIPTYAVSMQPADDMVIPIFLCKIHFNSFNFSLVEGVAADNDLFEGL